MKRYQHAIIAVDLFENHMAFVHRALFFAKAHTRRVTICHSVPYLSSLAPYAMSFQDALHSDAAERLKTLKANLPEALISDLKITFEMHLGAPKYKVCELAKAQNADLIITGSHGKHGVDLLLGSTANGILHLAHCDVLTIRVDFEGHCLVKHKDYQRMLLATDFFKDGEIVQRTFFGLAEAHLKDVAVVTVIPDATMLAVAYMPSLESEIEQQAKDHMEALRKTHGLSETQTSVHSGQPKLEILDAAAAHHADLIVLGSHGRGAIASMLLGSTANAVLHGAATDVLVVRIRG